MSIFIAAMTVASLASAGWFGPDNYPECILSELPGEVSDAVAVQKYLRCKNRFDERATVPKSRRYASGGDCVLSKAKNTRSQTAGNLITYACYALYEPEKPSPPAATAPAVAPAPPPDSINPFYKYIEPPRSNFFDQFDPPQR